MVEFLKKMMEWALEKEEELAKECKINPKEIDAQLYKITQKKSELEKRCQYEIAQIDKLIERLDNIKKESSSCESKNG